jgi:phosphoglycerate kinase
MKKLSVRDLDVAGKRVFLRVDFNVPISGGVIEDDTRIRASLPTIELIREARGRLIVASHLGRPKGKPQPDMSLAPVARQLSELLRTPVDFASDAVGAEALEKAKRLQDGQLLVLENLRFHAGEEKNDPDFAAKLASLAEVYVNDAFGSAHRAHASTAGMVKHFPKAAAGLLMEKELQYLGLALSSPPRPFVALLGGAKVSDKIEVVTNLLGKVDRLLIGGGMAYTFLLAKNLPTGKSLVEPDKVALARELLAKSGEKIELPRDHVVAQGPFEAVDTSPRKTLPIDQIPEGFMGLDIGPETVKAYSAAIRAAKTIVWNGPMGVFEKDPFAAGTLKLAEAVAESGATTIIGGGDSVAAVHMARVAEKIAHISTGGGASLEFLAGLKLPGVEALTDA